MAYAMTADRKLQLAVERATAKFDERLTDGETALATDAGYLSAVAEREAALNALDPRQRLFVLVYCHTGNMQHAARDTFSAPETRRTEASRTRFYADQASKMLAMDRVKHAIAKLCEVEQLRHGFALSWKRSALARLIEIASDPSDSNAYNPNAAVKAVELLSKLDDNIHGGQATIRALQKHAEKPAVTIQIASAIQRDEPAAIEGTVVPTLERVDDPPADPESEIPDFL